MQKQYDFNGDIQAAPLGDGDNLFDWHFTLRGPSDSPFEDGIYHGRLLFPPQYPMKPPEIFLLTPNGRFETNKKICLSISGYHPETWLPSWSVSTALRALQAFFCTPAKGAIGGLEWPEPERRRIAKLSPDWRCPLCDCQMKDILALRKDVEKSKSESPSVPAVDAKVASSEPADENNNPSDSDNKPAESENPTPTKILKTELTQTSAEEMSAIRRRTNSENAAAARNLERRRIEQQMLKQQLEYQRSDMWSIVFMAFLAIGVVLLAVRKMNNAEGSTLR